MAFVLIIICLLLLRKGGHLHILKFFDEHEFDWKNNFVCSEAAKNGHLNVLSWACSKGCPWTIHVARFATEHKHYCILEYIITDTNTNTDDHLIEIAKTAASHGYIDVLEFSREKGLIDIMSVFTLYETAVNHNHINVLIWLHDNGYIINHHTTAIREENILCCKAAYFGHFAVLKWLKEKNYHWFALSVANSAAKGNRFEILRWIHENISTYPDYVPNIYDTIVNDYVCRYAAKNNNLEMLLWANVAGYTPTKHVIVQAIRHNNIAMFQWAIANNYPLSHKISIKAVQYNNIFVFDYAREMIYYAMKFVYKAAATVIMHC